MEQNGKTPDTIDAYIAQAAPERRELLQRMREVIREAAPEATEKISWGMPTFYLHGNLVHFAPAQRHLGFYPGESGVADFESELSAHKTSKGCIRFPYDKPLPVELIQKIVRHRAAQNIQAAKAK